LFGPVTCSSPPTKPTSALYSFADHLYDGRLAEQLAAWRAEGQSFDSIAKFIWADTDRKVSVTGPGVQNWARQLGIDDPEHPFASTNQQGEETN
jgi:hypothetical protein